MMKKKIDRTFLRSDVTMNRYIEVTKERARLKTPVDPFTDLEERAIKKFNHWLIIENDFPYDAIALTSHLLFTRRKVVFDWDELNADELHEFSKLRKTYLNDNYDVLFENLPKGQTVPGHFHLHLLTLRREVLEK